MGTPGASASSLAPIFAIVARFPLGNVRTPSAIRAAVIDWTPTFPFSLSCHPTRSCQALKGWRRPGPPVPESGTVGLGCFTHSWPTGPVSLHVHGSRREPQTASRRTLLQSTAIRPTPQSAVGRPVSLPGLGARLALHGSSEAGQGICRHANESRAGEGETVVVGEAAPSSRRAWPPPRASAARTTVVAIPHERT